MIIEVDEDIILSQIIEKDKPLLVKYLNDKNIYGRTLRIPSPYTLEDAQHWINHVKKETKSFKKLKQFVIRNKKLELIGGVGFHTKYGPDSHIDEIGYWLGKDFWNKGIMTKTVKKFCEFGFKNLSLERIEAAVFEDNYASCKVLENAGFQFEGVLRNYVKKDGKLLNCKLYSILK